MGYTTYYALKLHGKDKNELKEIYNQVAENHDVSTKRNLLDEMLVDGLEFEERHYISNEEITPLSKKHPDVIFEIKGHGEDDTDQWRQRFLDGNVEEVSMKTEFPPFREILLPGETVPADSGKYILDIIAGNEAEKYYEENGFDKTEKATEEGIISGAVQTYELDTKADRETLIRALCDMDGWDGFVIRER